MSTAIAEPVPAARQHSELLRPAQRNGKKFLNPVPTELGTASVMGKALWRMLTTRAEREPAKPLGPFHTNTALYATPPLSGLRVTWFGHSSLLLEIDGARVLMDPVWSKRASFLQSVGPARFYAPTVALRDLPKIDAVLVSHDHYDHLDFAAIAEFDAWQPGVTFITSLGAGKYLRKAGVKAEQVRELNWTESTRVGALQFTALPARHFSGRSLFNRFETLWSAFAIRGPQHNVYFGADSGWWEGFAAIGQEYGPFDLTMLEIGAYDPLWWQIHLGPENALRAFRAMNPQGGLFLPIHWGLFNLALHAWRQPVEKLLEIAGDTALLLPEPGAPVEASKSFNSRWWQR